MPSNDWIGDASVNHRVSGVGHNHDRWRCRLIAPRGTGTAAATSWSFAMSVALGVGPGVSGRASMHSSHIGQAHNLEPAEGHDHHRDSEDPVDRLEGRLVAIAEDGHLGRDPDEQTRPTTKAATG